MGEELLAIKNRVNEKILFRLGIFGVVFSSSSAIIRNATAATADISDASWIFRSY